MKKLSDIHPPRLAERLFEWYCDTAAIEDLHGDVDELFYADLEGMSPFQAKVNYWVQVVSLIFSYAVKKRKRRSAFHPHFYTSNDSAMIKSYFKLAWRTVAKNKIYSAINVFGLALGVSACLVIYTVATHELSFDKFHPDGDRVYRVAVEQGKGENHRMSACVPAPAAAAIRDEISAGIETLVAYHRYSPKISLPGPNGTIKKLDRTVNTAIIAEPSYFEVFNYEWLAGGASALKDPLKVVLSERQARSYFGSMSLDEMVGKEVIYEDSLRASVVGIVKDWTENTDFPFTDFISFATIKSSFLKNEIMLDDWNNWRHSSQAFIKTKKGTSISSLEHQLSLLFKKHLSEPDDKAFQTSVLVQPLGDLHIIGDYDHHESILPTLLTLSTLALFILVIAIINFINLSTAQSIRRAKEIGIRKVMGSFRRSIALQFLVETFVVTFFAVCLAALLVNQVLTAFAAYLPSPVKFEFSATSILFLLFVTVATSILAGIYPARVMSAYLPALSLKGPSLQKGNERWFLRKGLIVFQFSSSLFFIIATIVIGNQIEYIRTKDRGFSSASVVTLRTSWGDKTNNLRVLAEKLRHISGVEDVTVQSVAPMGFVRLLSPFVYKGKTKIETAVSMRAGDDHFIKLYQIPLLAGRNIADSDSLKEFVINEYYSKVLGFKSPHQAIGEVLSYEGKEFPIVGVVDDFHEQSFHELIGATVIGNFKPFEHSIGIKLSEASHGEINKKAVLDQVAKDFKLLYPEESFDPHSVEDDIGWMHDREHRAATLMNTAMVLTIFISCLGVFGLAMFTAQVKTKEIGIRKVLGATLANITTMLCRDFMILILLAIVIASPIAWYFMNDWLSGFAYRTNLSLWVFVLAGVFALSLGLLTVSFHAIKAGMADPVKSLRTE